MKKLVAMLLVLMMALAFAACGNSNDGGESKKGGKNNENPQEGNLTPYTKKAFSEAEIGSYVFFGSYEQDNDTSNGKEDIEWLVLAREDDRILVISRYGLDCQQYNTAETSVTWETCSLRKWLNGTFLNEAFSKSERAMIPCVTVKADKVPHYDTDPGNDTTDQIFLLSITEAFEYFSLISDMQCRGTAYCYAKKPHKGVDGNCCWWWLRSPGGKPEKAASVGGNALNEWGGPVNDGAHAIRPALWIYLET